jgi:hypothetical protein
MERLETRVELPFWQVLPPVETLVGCPSLWVMRQAARLVRFLLRLGQEIPARQAPSCYRLVTTSVLVLPVVTSSWWAVRDLAVVVACLWLRAPLPPWAPFPVCFPEAPHQETTRSAVPFWLLVAKGRVSALRVGRCPLQLALDRRLEALLTFEVAKAL